MSDFPIQALVIPVIGLAVVAYYAITMRKRLAGQDQQYSNYRAGELARRLGLQLVEGDPAFNLFIRQANVDIRRGPADGRPVQVAVRMEGSPEGVPLQLTYLYRVEQETGLAEVVWRIWFDCRMSARTAAPFPAFEVLSRTAPLGPIAQTMTLPAQPTGDPAIDAKYLVATSEPRIAQVLGGLLSAFATFDAGSGIHLVGDGQTVSFVMKQDKAPLLANALYYAEAMATNLTRIARAVGG